jgi:hypothetical protein
MKQLYPFILAFICSMAIESIGQTIDYSPYPYNLNNPSTTHFFTPNISQASGCGNITWTVTNGTIWSSVNNEWRSTVTVSISTTVEVKWNDVADKGKLKATITCSEGTISVEKSFPICTLTGLTPQNPHANINWKSMQPCDYATSITLFVDVMMMTWTGGVNGSPMERADGYEWTIPAGWSANGQTGPATINTIEFISVTPATACSAGTISVRGYKECFGKKYSNSATFDMTKTKPVTIVQVPSAFTGSFCGNNQTVTFTGPTFSCATSYTWSVSAPGWLHNNPSVFTTTQNTVTLAPSGDITDAGTITVTANLNCGTTITSQPFTLLYKQPVIDVVGGGAICTTSKAVNLLNVAPNIAVTWSPGPKIQMISGQGTPFATMKQANVTIFGSEIINASASCSNSVVNGKNVWVGKPNDFLIIGPDVVAPSSFSFYEIKKWGWPTNNSYPSFAEQGIVSSGFTWSFGWPATSAGWNCGSCVGEYNTILAGSQSTYVTAHIQNQCGITTRDKEVFVQQENCPPGGCEEPFIVYPNPSSEEFSVTLNPSNENSNSEITLVDSNGTIVYSTKIKEGQVRVPTKQLRNGVYFLTVTRNKVTKKRHIIINH